MKFASSVRKLLPAISLAGQNGPYVASGQVSWMKVGNNALIGVLVALSGVGRPLPMPAEEGTRTEQATSGSQSILPAPSEDLLSNLQSVYEDIHANPELSMQEHRTAGIAADWLRKDGYEVTEKVGGTGVVGLLRNGDGPTVLLRADMDALPMRENTGLPYTRNKTLKDDSGRETPVAHSCGHDMHVTWLMGATQILSANKDRWRGTVMALFQPGEETGEGGAGNGR